MSLNLSKNCSETCISITSYLFTFLVLFCFFFSVSAWSNDGKTLTGSGALRILTWAGAETYLPRGNSKFQDEQQLLAAFAKENALEVETVPVTNYEDLIPDLLAGKGDVIASNMSITRQRKQKVAFTSPFSSTYEYLIHGKNTSPLKDAKSLNGRELYVPAGTVFWQTAKGLKKAYPNLKITSIDSEVSSEEIMNKLVSGEFDLSIKDSNQLDIIANYRNDVVKSLQASIKRYLGWAVHPKNSQLINALNAFIREEGLGYSKNQTKKMKPANQWEKINANKRIRIVMRNNMSSYFIWKGELHGFNYELAKDFAKTVGVRYQIIVAPDNEAMLQYIVDDKADIALGFITPNQKRKEMGLGFSIPYHYASEVVVSRVENNSIKTIPDLAGKSVHIRPSSSYWHTLEMLKQKIPDIELKAVGEDIETEEIISLVASKKYDLTVADSHLLALEMSWRDDVKGSFSLDKPKAQSWVVNSKNKQLLTEVNKYISSAYRGLFYNVSYQKYFENNSRFKSRRKDFAEMKKTGKLSPYDEMVKTYAKEYGFDWRLLVSQMYQESRFDPSVTSWAGAQGLFQVMPKTAKQMGFDDVVDPEKGIYAGVKYLNWSEERMKYSKPKPEELIWFTLAAYNAGAGHVRDAIELAKANGWRGDTWFGHVEKAMLLLSKKAHASQARHGYVRGQEPVDYVYNIRKRFEAYKEIVK